MEAFRHGERRSQTTGILLGAFGVPTADSVLACCEAFGDRPVIASGGLRTAVDMAKCLALGAHAAASALPFLKAAQAGVDSVVDTIETLIHGLRVIHFVCGASTPKDLVGRVSRTHV